MDPGSRLGLVHAVADVDLRVERGELVAIRCGTIRAMRTIVGRRSHETDVG